MMKKEIIIYLLSICWSFTVVAQQNVGFNHLTGTANVSIPLYNIGNVPIGLSYSARGIRVRQVAGPVGLGWNLTAGGNIVREIKGTADDHPQGGWLNTTAPSLIDSFSESYTSDCTSESDEHNLLSGIYFKVDTQPDVFYINTPFISGKFMFDNNKVIQVQPYQNLLIEHELDSGKIASFTITDDFGVRYEFDVADLSSRKVDFEHEDVFFRELQDHHNTPEPLSQTWHLSKVVWPNGQYINFEYSVMATTESVSEKSSTDGIAKNYKYVGSSEGSFGIPYTPIKTHTLKVISTSQGEKARFIFTSRSEGIVENTLARIERYTNDELISSYDFYYQDAYPESFQGWNPSDDDKAYEKRTFLASVNTRHNGKVYEGYQFDYHGVYDYYNKLPSHKSSAVDIYGFYKKNGIDDHADGVVFYNPAFPDSSQYYPEALTPSHDDKETEVIQTRELFPNIYYNHALDNANQYRIEPLPSGHADKATELLISANDRSVDASGLHYGTLSKFTFPTGGNIRFFYEANKYLDPTSNSEYYGPGIRLQKTIAHDGVSNKNNVTTNYSYQDEQTPSITSGVITQRPKYAFGTPYRTEIDSLNPALTFAQITGPALERAQFLSIRTNFDMASANTAVFYKSVGVSRKASGKTVFNFEIPATIDDQSANSGEWEPTEMNVARSNYSSTDCLILGRFTSGTNVYPFASNPNYNFRRGLISSVQSYNEAGDPISKTTYEYQKIVPDSLTTAIYGMTIDKIPTYSDSIGLPTSGSSHQYFYAYGKYKMFSNVRSARSKVTQTLYDPSDVTKKIITTTDYAYEAADKRLSNTTTTNSDGTVSKSYTKYVADYDTGYDVFDTLIQRHQNGLVVESFSTKQALNDVETVVSGSVTMFDDFNKSIIHPYKQYVLNKTATIAKSVFDSTNVSDSTFVMDDNYELIQTITDYDVNERVSSAIGKSQISSGTHWGYQNNTPLAQISNGKAENFLYSGFEDDSKYDFETNSITASTVQLQPVRTGAKSLLLNMGSSNGISGEIVKASKTDKLILSFWLLNQNAGTITYELKNTDGDTTFLTATKSYGVSFDWKYYEIVMDVSALDNRTYKASVSTNTVTSIDDILIYPEEATVSYRSVGSKRELLSESLAGKTTTYYEYDSLLRNTITRDDDKNILNKTDYADVEISPPVTYNFLYTGLNAAGEAVFEFINPEISGNSNFHWTFYDGAIQSETMTAGQKSITFDYPLPGIYNVTLVVGGGAGFISTQTVSIEDGPSIGICATGPQEIDQCLSTAVSIFQDGCNAGSGYAIVPTIFELGSLSNCANCENETITHNWQVQHEGTSTWTTVGTGDSVSLMYNNTFKVRCIVTVGTNPTITTLEKQVQVYKSNPGCPDFPAN